MFFFFSHCTAVEIGGIEYSFAGGAGIFCMTPKQAPGAVYRESIVMGQVPDGAAAIARAIEVLRPEFGPDDYNLLSRNCNAFADRLCVELVGKGIPRYCNRLASFGSFFSCFLPRELTQEAPVNQDPSTGVAAYPPVGRYVGRNAGNGDGNGYRAFAGEGMRMGNGGGGATTATTAAAETKEAEEERRERVRKATVARMASGSSSS